MRYIMLLLSLCTCLALGAGLAPVNPALVDYYATPEPLRSARYGDYIPEHNLDYAQPSDPAKSQPTLPAVYDLRQTRFLSPIRNQGYTSACWCFSACAAVESNWRQRGFGEYDLSENNIYYGHGYVGLHTGGNRYMSTTYFMRGAGPVLESQDPFQFDIGEYHSGITPIAYVTEAVWLPQNVDVNEIKQCIMDYGALDVAMNFSDAYFNTTDNTYYFPGYAGADINHLVNLVGWDDGISTAGGRGAWIVRNCWGTDWGDEGYFYVSYRDYLINRFPAYWNKSETYDSQRKILQYDEVGYIGDWGLGSDTAYSLIKYTIPAGSRLDMLGSYTTSSPTIMHYQLFSNFDGIHLSGLLAETEPDTLKYHGFYTTTLAEPLFFPQETRIYVQQKFHSPNYMYPLAVEYYWQGSATPPIAADVAWLSSNGTDGNWQAVGAGTSSPIDLCTKLYITTSSHSDDMVQAPADIQLFPNPVKAGMPINIKLPQAELTSVEIYNLRGQLVTRYNSGTKAEQHTLQAMDRTGNRLASGIYLCRISNKAGCSTHKLCVLN